MSDENHQLRQRVSQLESDVRVLRAALAESQAKEAASPSRDSAPSNLDANVAEIGALAQAEYLAMFKPRTRGRPPKVKE